MLVKYALVAKMLAVVDKRVVFLLAYAGFGAKGYILAAKWHICVFFYLPNIAACKLLKAGHLYLLRCCVYLAARRYLISL